MLPVLIVGAGPTGLALALWLTKIGIKVRIIDKLQSTLTTSRAIVVHSRTLEFYRQLGLADEMVARGFKFPAVNLWVRAKHRARFAIGNAGEGISPYPFVLIFPQDAHEKLLIEELTKLGVVVERGSELISCKNIDGGVETQIRLASGQTETVQCSYLAGCDGAHSVVRGQIGTGFQGSTFPGMFYVADISGTGAALNGELHVSLEQSDFLAIFPMIEKGRARLIGAIQDVNQDAKLEWHDVNPRVLNEMKITVEKVNWFSTYHIHHRVASNFQKGRIFLLGDAGHIHSPVGGQGMNTGIGDAINLAWKLGDVLKGKADSSLLTTYESERIAFARELVASTDEAFHFVSSQGRLARFVRMVVAPIVLPIAFSFRFVQKFAYLTVSQTGITYRGHLRAKGVQKGDRLPWIASVDNFASLKSLDWQIHVYGDREKALANSNFNSKHPIYVFSWNDEMKLKGLQQDKAYLVRPDGYVG